MRMMSIVGVELCMSKNAGQPAVIVSPSSQQETWIITSALPVQMVAL